MVNYTAHGDRNDLLDDDVPLPVGEGWVITSTLDGDAESFDYTAIKFLTRIRCFPLIFIQEIAVPILIIIPSYYYFTFTLGIIERFEIYGELGGRGVDDNYPKLYHLFADDSLAQQGFLFEIISYIFTETLQLTPIEFNQQGMVKIDLEQWLHQEVSHYLILPYFYSLKK